MQPPFIGNTRALAAVQRALAGDSPPHAWLFAGPESVGKRTLAVRLAQALNCARGVGARRASPLLRLDAAAADPAAQSPGPDPTPCGECRACARIAAGIHADVQTITFDSADDGRVLTDITVDQVREIERAVALNPFEGRTRVVIIDPADALNPQAQNAALKTLEEPPPHTAFVLITTREEALLPTIRSRCRRIEFSLVPVAEIEQALLGSEDPNLRVEPERAALLARLSSGRIGWALDAARDPSLLERLRESLEQARAIPGMTIAERMRLSEQLAERFKVDRAPVFALLDEWLGWWRDVLLAQSAAEEGIANADTLDELRAAGARHSPDDVIRFVRALRAARDHLNANVQSRIALDALLLEAPQSARTAARM
jgi:DNA polymerase-3 subunit delta'